MTRSFVICEEFEKSWKRLELGDEEMIQVQDMLLADPSSGDMMQGTGGARKLRIAINGHGKSGGARVIYVDFIRAEKIYLITAYGKNEKSNLTKEECNEIKRRVRDIEANQISGRRREYECI